MHTTQHQPHSPEALASHFLKVHKEYENEFPNQELFLKETLHMVTVKFNRGSVRIGSPNRSPLKEFGKLHFHIARDLLGNRIDRKRVYQPLAWAFVDVEGSRHGGKVNIHTPTDPHIHALMLVRPEHALKFRSRRFWYKMQAEHFLPDTQIKDVQFKQYEGTVLNMTKYCMKGYLGANRANVLADDLYQVFPR